MDLGARRALDQRQQRRTERRSEEGIDEAIDHVRKLGHPGSSELLPPSGSNLPRNRVVAVLGCGSPQAQVRSGSPSTPSGYRHSVPRRDSVT